MEEEDKIVQKTSRIRLIKDKMAGSMMLTFTLVSVLLVVLIGIGLVLKSLPILHDKSLWEHRYAPGCRRQIRADLWSGWLSHQRRFL